MVIDDILGQYDRRYLGAGHKRTNYELLHSSSIYKNSKFTSVAKVSQTASWSEKNGVQLSPHLSTIDIMVLSALAIESYFLHHHPTVNIRSLYISSIEIRTGMRPVEDLERVPIVIDRADIDVSTKLFCFTVLIVAGIKAKLQLKLVEFLPERRENEGTRRPYISNHLKEIRHDIKNIDFISDDVSTCDVLRKKEAVDFTGISSNLSEPMSLLEWLVIFSQMGQVLIYKFDGIDRNASETLWMRWVKVESDCPYFHDSQGTPLTAKLDKALLLPKGGEAWRSFDLSGYTNDRRIKIGGKLAHRLPIREK